MMNEVCIHTHSHISVYAGDPTRTTTLRRAFVRELNRRFAALVRVVRRAVIVEDVFGLKEPGAYALTTPGPRRFAFPRSQVKVEEFMRWFNQQVEAGVLQTTTLRQVGVGAEAAWTNKYVLDSYKRGVIRARYELQKAGFGVPSLDSTGGIDIAMGTPFHLDRVGLLYSRVFTELKGITAAMDQQISRVLSQGLIDGDGPRVLAGKLVATINGAGMGDLGLTDTLGRFIPARRRAEIMARTEVIRAHHQATIQEYKNWAVEGIVVQAEWVTAGDDRVCSQCAQLEREVFPLDVAQAMIPLHPQCRCIALPYKPPAGTEQVESWRDDPVASNMIDPENSRKYMRFKQEYTDKLNSLGASRIKEQARAIEKYPTTGTEVRLPRRLQKFIEEDKALQKMKEVIGDWQRSTTRIPPMAWKYRISTLEKNIPNMAMKSRHLEEITQYADMFFSVDDYLHIRAFNQAYMDLLGTKRVTLLRGTDGQTGKRIRESLEETFRRTNWRMVDSSLAGYTDMISVADDFGLDQYGISIRVTFDSKNIFIHRDMLGPLTGRYYNEREWITVGINRLVPIKNMRFRVKAGQGYRTKEFGVELEEFLREIHGL